MRATTKRWLTFAIKLSIAIGVQVLIFRKVLAQENATQLWERITELSWGWVALAAVAQLSAIVCAVFRWDGLLRGQGIRAPFRHLFGSFMVGRFFGAVTPGGFVGLDGYRLYDIAKYTDKTARSTGTIAVEKLAGWLGISSVIVGGSIFGVPYLGLPGVIAVDLFFLGVVSAAMLLLARPTVFRTIARSLIGGVPTKIETLIDAVCAYRGKGRLLLRAFVLSAGVHFFNNLIYVAAARALGLELGVGEVFFVTSVQIFATLMPVSINGVGIREAAAVGLYTIVGVPAGLAVLVPIVGFTVEMIISSMGGLVLVSRRTGYRPVIEVEDAEREDAVHAEAAEIAIEPPSIARGLGLGLGAGLLAGLFVGVGEGLVVLLSSSDAPSYRVLAYGAVAYGLLLTVAGGVGGAALAAFGRLIRRQAFPAPIAYGRMAALLVALPALALGAFRVRRDVFHEELVWKSRDGLLVLLSSLVASAVLYFLLAAVLRWLTDRRVGAWLLHRWGTPAFALVLVLGLSGAAWMQPSVSAPTLADRGAPVPAEANDVLVIVVDTLRADRLPDYGYSKGETPHLQAFAKDAIRFDQAFANSSWTRPSFASILTGRYASGHQVMSKADALPDELETMPEAFAGAGYHTAGIATNYNVAPFFNFHQGFDDYRYLEPDFVLGAGDNEAKLLFVQVLKRVVERFSPARPGGAYQDAERVNQELFALLDRAPRGNPFFFFVGYMDPHDPYFQHPYGEPGYSRAGHPNPDAKLAPRLSALYDGEITYWDRHFGKLIEELKRRKLYETMTIVITSDHGEEFLEHGGFWHGTTLYDEQIRVPLYVKLPYGEGAGTTVSHWVQSIDLMPTLLRRNGLAEVQGVNGNDLFVGSGEVFAEESHEGNVLQSLRTRRGRNELKIITANPGNPRGLATSELYRVDVDPGEHVNLAEETPAVADLATARLEYRAGQAAEGAVQKQGVDVDDEASLAKLRALGYAGAEGNGATN